MKGLRVEKRKIEESTGRKKGRRVESRVGKGQREAD